MKFRLNFGDYDTDDRHREGILNARLHFLDFILYKGDLIQVGDKRLIADRDGWFNLLKFDYSERPYFGQKAEEESRWNRVHAVATELGEIIGLYDKKSDGLVDSVRGETSGELAACIIDFVDELSVELDEKFPEIKEMLMSVLSHQARCTVTQEGFDKFIPKNIRFED